MNLDTFLAEIAVQTYPEPRTEGHDGITAQMAREFVKYIPKSALILDIGCGQGPALEWFTNEGYSITGLALNEEDVIACIERKLFAFRADMHNTKQPSDYYDAVWARHVLEHSVAPLYALREIHRILSPRGHLYMEVPAPDTSCNHESNQNHYSVMGLRMWLNLLAKAGFSPITGEVREINLVTGAGPDKYFSVIATKN